MAEMTSRERVLCVLEGGVPDRVPLYSFTVDPKFIKELGGGDPFKTFQILNLDIYPIRNLIWCQDVPVGFSLKSEVPKDKETTGGVFAGWEGVDEFGRLWHRGSYVGGTIKAGDDLAKAVPELRLEERTDPDMARAIMSRFADKAFCLVSHSGPFGLTMESMGLENFSYALYDDRPYIEALIEARTDWFIGISKYLAELGVDIIFMGDDVAYKGRPFISPKDFDELVFPQYRRIVEAVDIPVIWHSDGYIMPLLAGAVQAGFRGVQALEPGAGMDLGQVKKEYGDKLVLVGNVGCAGPLLYDDLEAGRQDVRRCMSQAKEGGGYILSDSNSLHSACNTKAVVEMFRYAKEIGRYE